MAPTPPSTGSSVDGQSPNNQYRVVRKRNRIPLSCAPCRARKLKCNRSLPCEKCIKRGDAASCSFATATTRKKSVPSTNSESPNSDEMQGRIDRLESLVLSLMSNGANGQQTDNGRRSVSESNGSADYSHDMDENDMIKEEGEDGDDNDDCIEEEDSDVEGLSNSMGVMRVMDKTQTQMYFGEAHWGAVLKDIAELKDFWSKKQTLKKYEDQMDKINHDASSLGFFGIRLFNGLGSAPEPKDLIAALPNRSVTDKLINRYFTVQDMSMQIMHVPTFWKQYERHFANPSSSKINWIGSLYAMMCIALLSYHRAGDEPQEYRGKSLQVAAEYRAKTIQCLLRDTSQSSATILLLVLYNNTEYCSTRDTSIGVWLVCGLIARIAMRLGFHRDGKRFPIIKPFEAEMRRRMWAMITCSDLLFSFQVGLPSIINLEHVDTELPSNLYDEDFDEDTTQLPPSRPLTDPTPTMYLIIKSKLAATFRRIVDCTTALTPRPYEDVMRLDSSIQACRDAIPHYWRMRPMEHMRNDSPKLIMDRFNLDMLYLKARAVLHRRHLAKARTSPKYAFSRQVCVDSSMQLLNHQAVLHDECRPGAPLASARWYNSSLTTHEFLLAAMVICLDGYYSAEALKHGDTNYSWDMDRGKDLVHAIIRSRDIWDELKDHSIEAYKAATTITVMIDKLTESCPDKKIQNLFQTSTSPQSNGINMNGFDADDAKPEHSAAMTLGMLSGGLTPNNTAAFERTYPLTPGGGVNMIMGEPQATSSQFAPDFGATVSSPFSFFGNNPGMMNDMPSNLDFEAWDSYLQGSNSDSIGQLFPSSMDIPTSTSLSAGLDFNSQQSQQGPSGFQQQTTMYNGVGDYPSYSQMDKTN